MAPRSENRRTTPTLAIGPSAARGLALFSGTDSNVDWCSPFFGWPVLTGRSGDFDAPARFAQTIDRPGGNLIGVQVVPACARVPTRARPGPVSRPLDQATAARVFVEGVDHQPKGPRPRDVPIKPNPRLPESPLNPPSAPPSDPRQPLRRTEPDELHGLPPDRLLDRFKDLRDVIRVWESLVSAATPQGSLRDVRGLSPWGILRQPPVALIRRESVAETFSNLPPDNSYLRALSIGQIPWS